MAADVIKLPSRFDYSHHKEFSDGYASLLESTEVTEVILDFTMVDYLDSSALGMMVLLQKKFAAKNKIVKVKGAKGQTRDILVIANMQKIFEFI